MKKTLASIVLFIYLFVSSGFSVSVHYCMDEFDSAEMGISGEEECESCGMYKDEGCCRDEVKLVKLNTSHISAVSDVLQLSIPTPIELNIEFLFSPLINHLRTSSKKDHGPPFQVPDVYLINCVFRI